MARKSLRVYFPDSFLFSPHKRFRTFYSENRIRQLFLHYIKKAELDQEYGRDSKGKMLHQFTVHSLRHSHITHFIHHYKVPLPVVQKQCGHRSLKSTSVYLNPSEEMVIETYDKALSTVMDHQREHYGYRNHYIRK